MRWSGLPMSLLVLALAACGQSATPRPPAPSATPTARPLASATTPATISPTPIPGEVYVALGASDTAGVGATNPGSEGWVYVLYRRMPVATKLVNLGMPGAHLHEALSAQLPEAIAENPSMVTAWFGVNDLRDQVAPPEFERDLAELLGQLRSRTQAQVFLADIPDITALPRFEELAQADRAELARRLAEYNRAIERQVAGHGVSLVHLAGHNLDLTGHPEFVANDGYHPSTQGHGRIAQLFWEAIAR